jgi:hypothetical protein
VCRWITAVCKSRKKIILIRIVIDPIGYCKNLEFMKTLQMYKATKKFEKYAPLLSTF